MLFRVMSACCAVFLACLGSLLFLSAKKSPAHQVDFSEFRSHTSFDQSRPTSIDIKEILPPGFVVPPNAVSARLTINPAVNAWFSAEMGRALIALGQRLPDFEGLVSPDTIQVNAVLIDAKSRIRVIYSNSETAYFGPGRLPLASTAKIFVAVGLGQHDDASMRYCVPRTFTSWLTVDAARRGSCPARTRTVSARTAFARSMPAPLLWRSHQVLTDASLGRVFQKLGVPLDTHGSLKEAAIMGALQARPIEMHRAVQAITLALTESTRDARLPTLIDEITTEDRQGQVQRIEIDSPSISRDSYLSVVTPPAAAYVRDVLQAPIKSGTLQSLSDIKLSSQGISLLWGKTGTYAVRGRTLDAWIVGGLNVRDEPYSWVFLIRSSDEGRSFGNTNAASFAPIARLLVEAAIRDRSSDGVDAILLPIGP